MLLQEFNAEKVYGYLPIKILFHKDVSFLVGANGCGKTTALKLIQALLSPNFKSLITIPFDFVELKILENEESITITATKDDKKLSINTSNQLVPFELDLIETTELRLRSKSKSISIDEYLQHSLFNNKNHPIIQFLDKINTPLFLGLERRQLTDCQQDNDFRHYYDADDPRVPHYISRKSFPVDNDLNAGLIEAQLLVQNAYKRIRQSEDRYNTKLKDKLLISSFSLADARSLFISTEDTKVWEIKNQISKRKEEIRQSLFKVGAQDEKFIVALNKFFDKLDELLNKVNKNGTKNDFMFDWLINKTQLDRILSFIELIDDNKTQLDRLFAPIQKFIATTNEFYQDSFKKVVIDTVGHIEISRIDGKKISPEALSSGERQLLIIFANIIFSKFGRLSNIFLIDEPELSLHLGWQEILVDRILSVSPEAQFIMATHSPDIVNKFSEKAINISRG